MPRIPIESCPTPTRVLVAGQELLAFGGCNYLGLAHHPRVHAALTHGLARFGVSTTASRETTGNTLAHEELEHDLAEWLGQESAILSAEGYTANFMCCQALAAERGVALVDERAHRSIKHAASAAGFELVEYAHLDADSAAWHARRLAARPMVMLTDSVFAADGGVAPLPQLLKMLPANATLVVDDCHGVGVLGPAGRGAVAAEGLDDPRIVITTTLAKGLGCYGGCVAGRDAFVRRVQDRAWVYRSSTPVPPAMALAVRAALDVLRTDPGLVNQLRANAAHLREVFERLGLPLPAPGIPIFTFAMDSDAEMERVEHHVRGAGILAPLIDYPGGPCPRYFRVVVNAAHTPAEIDRLGSALISALATARGRVRAAG